MVSIGGVTLWKKRATFAPLLRYCRRLLQLIFLGPASRDGFIFAQPLHDSQYLPTATLVSFIACRKIPYPRVTRHTQRKIINGVEDIIFFLHASAVYLSVFAPTVAEVVVIVLLAFMRMFTVMANIPTRLSDPPISRTIMNSVPSANELVIRQQLP